MEEKKLYQQEMLKIFNSLLTYEEYRALCALLEMIESKKNEKRLIYYNQSFFCSQHKLHINCLRTTLRYLVLIRVINLRTNGEGSYISIIDETFYQNIIDYFLTKGENNNAIRMDRRRNNPCKKIL